MNNSINDDSFDGFLRQRDGKCFASDVKRTVEETSSEEETLPEGEAKTDYIQENNLSLSRMAFKTQSMNIKSKLETSLDRLCGLPHADSEDNLDGYVDSDSLVSRAKASLCSRKPVVKSCHTPALCSIDAASSHIVKSSNQLSTAAVRRKPIIDLADSDSSDDSLPILTSNVSTTRRNKKNMNTQALGSVDKNADSNIYRFSKGPCSSELRIDKKKSSASTKYINKSKNWRDADSGSSYYKHHLDNFSITQNEDNQYASPELRAEAKIGVGTMPKGKSQDKDNAQRTGTQKVRLSDSSDCDELSNYMDKWRKTCKDDVASDHDGSCGTDLDSSFIVETCDEDDLSYYLHSLNEALVQDDKKTPHQDFGSISEDLLAISDPNLPRTKSTTRNNSVVYELLDSTGSNSSFDDTTTLRPRIQEVCLTDSDDDIFALPSQSMVPKTPQLKARDNKGSITPLPAKTHKPAPRKTLVCPQTVQPIKSCMPSKTNYKSSTVDCATTTLSFLASLSAHPGSDRLHPEAVPYLKNFKRNCDNLVVKLYKLFNSQCFDNGLPFDMSITWNVRLTKTAGYCKYVKDLSKPNRRGAKIELSTKVLDNCERLRDTLIHELCHAASWIISGYRDGHGALFKSWGWKAIKRFPELPAISRCHNYKISCKYTYRCTKCHSSIGRHSKSLDISRKVCGRCRAPFELLVNGKSSRSGAEGVQGTPRTPAPFALFVKENYGSVKKSTIDLKHAEVMKILGEQFKEMKT